MHISMISTTFYSVWIIVVINVAISQNTNGHPCRPNPCFNGGRCFRVVNNTRDFQCRCGSDYVGDRCESTDKSLSAIGVLCGNTERQMGLDLACPPSSAIMVEYAAYGLPSNETALTCHSASLETANRKACVYTGSLSVLMNVCHGLTTCSLPPLNRLFPNLENFCKLTEETELALEYRLRCQLAETEETAETTPAATTETDLVTTESETSTEPAVSTVATGCQESTDYLENGVCYRIQYTEERSKRKSWMDARKRCSEEGGDLAGPLTADMHQKLTQKMKILDERRVKYFWIGARVETSSENEAGAVVRWTSGEEVEYVPNGSKLDEGECVVYYVQPGRNDSTDRSVWLAKSCSLYYNWICKIPMGILGAATTTVSTSTVQSTVEMTSDSPTTTRPRPRPRQMLTKAPRHGRTRARTQSTPTTTTSTTTSTTTTTTTTTATTSTTTETTTSVGPTSTVGDVTVGASSESAVVVGEKEEVSIVGRGEPSLGDLVNGQVSTSTETTTAMSTLAVSDTQIATSMLPGIMPVDLAMLPVFQSGPGHQIDLETTSSTVSSAGLFPTQIASDGEITTTVDLDPTSTTSAVTTTASSTQVHATIAQFTPILADAFCDASQERGVSWPITPLGGTSEQPCPRGTTGTARWHCQRSSGRSPVTSHRDLSECCQLWFHELHRQIEIGGSASKLVEDLSVYLMNSTKTTFGGDINSSLIIIRQFLHSQWELPDRTYSQVSKFSKLIGSIIDFWMWDKNDAAWKDWPTLPRMALLSSLMVLVEENANLLAYFAPAGTNERINFTSYAVQVQVYQSMTAQNSFTRTGIAIGPDSDAPQPPPMQFSLGQLGHITLPVGDVLQSANSKQDDPGSAALSRQLTMGDEAEEVTVAYFGCWQRLDVLLRPAEEETGRTTIVNSPIISATVHRGRKDLRFTGDNVTFNLKHLRVHLVEYAKNIRCVYWNIDQNVWDTQGCQLLNSSLESTWCTCNHLTSFAILMDVSGDTMQQANVHREILKYVTMAGCALSSACLALAVIVFTFFRSLWSVRNSVHRNLCICLLIGELLFLVGIDQTKNEVVCTSIAISLHYFFLAAFCWMFMEGYQLYSMLVRVFEPPELAQLVRYYVVAFGAPAVVVAVSVALGKQHYGTSAYCWINANSSVVWAFVGPVALVTLANMIFLAIALKVACGVNTVENRSKAVKIKGWLKGSTMLLCLLGLTWIFGFFLVIRPAVLYFSYIFTVLNSLQGLFIVTFHVLLNEKVHTIFKKRYLHCWPNYYAVNGRSRGTSNESKQWPNHLTTSTSVMSYGYPNGANCSSVIGPREMMENDSTSRRRRLHEHGQQTSTTAGDRKYSKSNTGQVLHKPDARSCRQQAPAVGTASHCQFSVDRQMVSPYHNAEHTANRHTLFVADDQNDNHTTTRNRFYYSTAPTVVSYVSARGQQTGKPQKYVERF